MRTGEQERGLAETRTRIEFLQQPHTNAGAEKLLNVLTPEVEVLGWDQGKASGRSEGGRGTDFLVSSCREGEMREMATGWETCKASSTLRSLSTWITW